MRLKLLLNSEKDAVTLRRLLLLTFEKNTLYGATITAFKSSEPVIISFRLLISGTAVPYWMTLLVLQSVKFVCRITVQSKSLAALDPSITFRFPRYSLIFVTRRFYHFTNTSLRHVHCRRWLLAAQCRFGFLHDGREITDILHLPLDVRYWSSWTEPYLDWSSDGGEPLLPTFLAVLVFADAERPTRIRVFPRARP